MVSKVMYATSLSSSPSSFTSGCNVERCAAQRLLSIIVQSVKDVSVLAADGRRAFRSSLFEVQPKFIHVLVQGCLIKVFCQHVRRIINTSHLFKLEIFLSQSVLDPKIGSGKVPNFAQSAPSAYSDGCRGISHYLELKFDAKVDCQRLQSKPLRCSFADPGEFCFRLAQRHCNLGGRPVLHKMSTAGRRPTGGTSPGHVTATKVRVYVCD